MLYWGLAGLLALRVSGQAPAGSVCQVRTRSYTIVTAPAPAHTLIAGNATGFGNSR